MSAGFLVPFLLGLAAACLYLASWLGGPAWVLAWPALSAALLAVCYLLGAPGLLGKRPDGTRAVWAWLPFGPYLAFTLVVHHLARLLPEPALDEVAPNLFVGRRVLAHELPAGIQRVVDLTAELHEPRGVRQRAHYRCLPTLDATVPDPAGLAALVEELARLEEPLFLHCAQGHGRSATLAAAILLRRGACADPDAAEALMRRARPGIRLKPAQRRVLARFMAHSPAEGRA